MRRPLSIMAALGLVATVLATIVTGSAPSALAQAPTPYSGGGSANLLEVHGDLSALDLDLADVILSPASTNVDSEAEPRSEAHGANLDASLLGAIDLSGILSEAHQSAPPTNDAPAENTLIPLPLDPLLNLGVSNSTAHAQWAGDGQCLPVGTSLAFGHNDTAQATVLDVPNVATVASVNTAGGATFTESEVYMTGSGTARGLESVSTTQVDTITLLAGTPLEINIGVASTPTLTATANGQPGGASVTYSAPLVTIDNPDLLAPLNEVGDALNDLLGGLLDDVLPDLLDPVLNPDGGVLADVVSLEILTGEEILAQPGNQTIAADGTSATASTSVVRVRLTVLGLLGEPLLELSADIGPMTANVAVPEGGISCPPEINPFADLHKDSTVGEVAPGGQFDYTLTIPNHPQSPCDLTNVVVTDTITSPPGTEITTVPAADSVDGDTYTWNVGDLAINESRSFTVTVNVPDDAPDGFVFNDVLKASGDCDGTPVDHTVELSTPTVTDNFTGPCDLGDSNKAASHLEVLPGQTFSYFVHVFNSGAEPCSGVEVGDTLDDQLSFVSCTYGCTNEGQDVTWTGLSVPGGSGVTLAVTVQVAEDGTGALSNTAIIGSPDDPEGPTAVTVNGPEITDRSVPAPPNPAIRSGGEAEPLPRTGTNLPLALGAFALMAVAFLGIRRRMATTG